jgi:hypothetical protein
MILVLEAVLVDSTSSAYPLDPGRDDHHTSEQTPKRRTAQAMRHVSAMNRPGVDEVDPKLLFWSS